MELNSKLKSKFFLNFMHTAKAHVLLPFHMLNFPISNETCFYISEQQLYAHIYVYTYLDIGMNKLLLTNRFNYSFGKRLCVCRNGEKERMNKIIFISSLISIAVQYFKKKKYINLRLCIELFQCAHLYWIQYFYALLPLALNSFRIGCLFVFTWIRFINFLFMSGKIERIEITFNHHTCKLPWFLLELSSCHSVR